MAKVSPTMLVADVFEQKDIMERAIARAVIDALHQFESATGFTPRGINVQLLQTERLGEPRPDYVLDRVEVDLDL